MIQSIPKLHTVYDFADQSAFDSSFVYILLITLFTITAYFVMKRKNYSNPWLLKFQRNSIFMAIFAFLLLLIVTLNELKTYFKIKSTYENKQYSVVEGRVQDYELLKRLDQENFRVDSLYFSFNDNSYTTFAFTNDTPHTPLIRPNLYVRIYYPTYGKICILHLETE